MTKTDNPGSDVGAVCHIGHIHLSISEFRETTAIDFRLREPAFCVIFGTRFRVNNPNIGYEKRKTDIYSDNFCSAILVRAG